MLRCGWAVKYTSTDHPAWIRLPAVILLDSLLSNSSVVVFFWRYTVLLSVVSRVTCMCSLTRTFS